MSLWCIAVYRNIKTGPIEGYVLADSESIRTVTINGKEMSVAATRGVKTAVCLDTMRRGTKIENLALEGDQIKFTSGTEEDYASYKVVGSTVITLGTGTKSTKECSNNKNKYIQPVIIVAKDSANGGIVQISSDKAMYGVYREQQIIEAVEKGLIKLSNATIVNDNGTKYIRSKRGELETVNLAEKKDAPAPAPAPAPVKAENKPEVKEPVAVKSSVPTPPINNVEDVYSTIFEFGTSEEFGIYIKKVIARSSEEIDRVFGAGNRVMPFKYKGMNINKISPFAFSEIVPSFEGVTKGEEYKHWYSNGLSYNVAQYEKQALNRFSFDGSGKKGFICIDFDSAFYTRIVDNQLRIVNYHEPVRFYGTVIIPHYNSEGKIPVAINCSIGTGNSQMCLLENIKVVEPKTFSESVGVDISRSAMTFITDEAAEGNGELRWVKLNSIIEKIHDHAFSQCKRLNDITFTSALKEIGASAFSETALHVLKYAPGTEVARVGRRAFEYSSLNSLDLGFITGTISTAVFAHTPLKGAVTIPGTVSKLGSSAFVGTGVDKIILENGVESIGATLNTTEAINRRTKAEYKKLEIVCCKTLLSIGELQSKAEMSYTITLGHDWPVEKCAISLKNTTKEASVVLNYIDKAADTEKSAFLTMLEAMGEENLINAFTSREGGNDTPFTLEQLLTM